MFASLPSQNRRCLYIVAASAIVHVVVMVLLVRVHLAAPFWLQPSAPGGALARIDMSTVVYLGPKPAEKKQETVVRQSLLTYPRARQTRKKAGAAASPAVAQGLGPILKSYPLLVPSIHDIQIALPVTTPDPEIRRSDLPKGFEGDAVVEIMIDKTGKVVRTKIVQALGYDGLDVRITSTLMNWKFTPAYFDGVPVASLQEIHLHYPDDAVSS
jgi:TonB family protein